MQKNNIGRADRIAADVREDNALAIANCESIIQETGGFVKPFFAFPGENL